MTLVGRTAAARTLTGLLAHCAAGHSRAVLVEGPTGCGKSTLVHGIVEQAAATGAVVLCAAGLPAERRTPYGVVRRLAGGRRGPTPPGGTADRGPGADEPRSFRDQLRETGAAGPVVLCVDDAHHADDESLAFLQHLVRHGRPARLLLVVAGTVPHEAGRPAFATGLLRRPAFRRIRVERLTPAEVTAFATAHGCREQAPALYRTSGGNPLLLHALLEELAASRSAFTPAADDRTGPRELAPDPAGPFVRAVCACLHRAGPTAAQVAQAAALLGGAATPRRIAELAGVSPAAVRQGLAALEGAGLVTGVRFPHPAVRGAVLSGLSPTVRAMAGLDRARQSEAGGPVTGTAADVAADTTAVIAADTTAVMAVRKPAGDRETTAVRGEMLPHVLLGERTPDRPRAAPGSGLSGSERRVAALAAQGLTNREISARLYLTVSTVEQHLTRVYRKLRISGRADLPAASVTPGGSR